MVKYSELEPILFINECDALLSTRKMNDHSSIDQTNHALQNILLQEIEDLNGILICTTNLLSLDPAYSRRFLMKIEFDKPTTEAKFHIWKDKIPALKDDDALVLSEKYSLSGGEIDNISRKYQLNKMLYNKALGLEELEKYCQSETLGKRPERKKIGFLK